MDPASSDVDVLVIELAELADPHAGEAGRREDRAAGAASFQRRRDRGSRRGKWRRGGDANSRCDLSPAELGAVAQHLHEFGSGDRCA